MTLAKDISGVYEQLKKQQADELGTNSKTYTAGTVDTTGGVIICAIKALGGDLTITSAKDAAGSAITELATIVIKQSDVYLKQLSELAFTGTAAEVYFQELPGNFEKSK